MNTDTREALAALMVLAAECAQRKPLRGFEELTEAIHIGHRQFGRAHEKADEDVRMLAVRLRAVFDTLAAALATQPAQPSAQGEAVAWKLVPVEPTLEMMVAGERRMHAVNWERFDEGVWRAMLASAPAAPAQPTCTRSHPHEDMSPTCEALTVKARNEFAARTAQQSARGEAVAPEDAKVGDAVWFRMGRMYGTPPVTPVRAMVTAYHGGGVVDLEIGCEDMSQISGSANRVRWKGHLTGAQVLDGACWWHGDLPGLRQREDCAPAAPAQAVPLTFDEWWFQEETVNALECAKTVQDECRIAWNAARGIAPKAAQEKTDE